MHCDPTHLLSPGNFYNEDIPLEKDKVTFTFVSFPMDRYREFSTSVLHFILDYEKTHGFVPNGIAVYIVKISCQRIAGPCQRSSLGEQFKFSFDPIYHNPNDTDWDTFLISFNTFARENGGRPCLNQTLMLEHDKAYGASAISTGSNTSQRFVSSSLQAFLDRKEDA